MSGESPEISYQWYAEHRSTYAALAELVRGTVESLLRAAKIDYLSVTQRAKTLESFSEKIDRKAYRNPAEEMTDLAGIRIITFIEQDVQRACEVIRRTYRVHDDKSLDKARELDVDRFGYRSVHFVCDLGDERANLPEFALYRGALFEVQVRTVLQHAWAEIEHDRNYKLSGVLPKELQRRLYSVAGTLEIADREFNAIASEVDTYAKEVAGTTKAGDLDIGLDSTSLREYLKSKLAGSSIHVEHRPILPEVIGELRDYGIQTLAELDKIFTKSFLQLTATHKSTTTDVGLLRTAMMLHDFDKYVTSSWKGHFTGLAPSTRRLLAEKYGEAKVKEFVSRIKPGKKRPRQ